jgi:predicted enzyme related to lactoylglutathione lyase
MHTVTGIGGFFFVASDPEALANWYHENLGVPRVPQSYDDEVWQQREGPTVFGPLSSDQLEGAPVGPRGWGINFRVADLDAMVEQLRASGVEPEVDPVTYPNGRFAALHDPDGNPVQLWEPT